MALTMSLTPSPADIRELDTHLRPEDRRELDVLRPGAPVIDIVQSGVMRSEWSMVVRHGRTLLAIAGVVPAPEDHGAIPWMLCAREVEEHPLAAVRFGRMFIDLWLLKYKKLFNCVHTENASALRYIRALGFNVRDEPLELPSGAFVFYFELQQGDS